MLSSTKLARHISHTHAPLTHSHTLPLTHTHSLSHTQTLSHTHTHSLSHTHTHSLSHTPPHPLTHSRTLPLTHALPLTHIHNAANILTDTTSLSLKCTESSRTLPENTRQASVYPRPLATIRSHDWTTCVHVWACMCICVGMSVHVDVCECV